MPVDAPKLASPVVEPLTLSAPLSRRLAATCCKPPPDGQGDSCESYHGLWPYLRIMGLGKTLSGLGDRFVEAIQSCADEWREWAPGRTPRVLVSGSADYSMLAHVLHVSQARARPVEVVVLDRCETPLRSSLWYAQQVGHTGCTTVCSDVLDFRTDQRFDLIVTSSFLGYFNPAQRVQLFHAYAGLLNEGGRLVFTNRLRSGPEDQQVGFSPAQADKFVAQVLALEPGLPPECRAEPGDLEQLARRYVALFHTYSVNNVASVERLAEASGLVPLCLEVANHAATQSEVSGPTTSDASPYVFAVLRRPTA